MSALKLIALTGVAASALLAGVPAQAQETITIDRSSTVFPVTEAVAEEFQSAEKGRIRVTVGVSGTGGGFKKFCRGETDISDASRPISKEEMETCKAAGISYIEIPVAYDALTVAVSPKNTWLKEISVEDLKKIWEPAAQGKITTWKQVRPEWPDEPIALFGAGSDSGTFDYFTEAVVGKAKSSRGDYTGSEDDNVLVQGIEGNKNALGYVPYAYYAANPKRLKAVPIVAKAGAPAVAPSLDNVKNGSYQPLARPLFIYVSAKSADRAPVKKFVAFFMKRGTPLIEEVRYLPLPAENYTTALKHFETKKLGTVFGGKPEVGLTVAEILKREAVN